MDFMELFKEQNAEKQFVKLQKKYKNKKIVLYGAGEYFKAIKTNFDISLLNIVAVTDKKYDNIMELKYNPSIGYNVISPRMVKSLNPDIVLLTVYDDFYLEKFICEKLFVDVKYKFKYRKFFKDTLQQVLKKEMVTLQ